MATPPPSTDFEDLLPVGVAADFIGTIERRSIAVTLGNNIRMSASTEAIPLVSFQPVAAFVNPRYGGRKPVTEIHWSAEKLVAEEVAAIVAVPTAWIRDADFDVEGQVETGLANAVADAVDAAILFGVGAPASFPSGGVVPTTPVTGPDALAAISAGMSALEGQGITPDGIGGGTLIGGALRQAYLAAAALPSEVPANTIWGLQVVTSPEWDDSRGDAVVGGWQYLAIGIREDIRFATTDTGPLYDSAGELLTNLWQDNMTAVKVTMWLGCAVGRPIDKNNQPVDPLVAVDWTATTP